MAASSTEVRQLLAGVPLFAGLDAQDLDALAARFQPVDLEPGEAVMRQGGSGDAMYLVAAGELLVEVDGSVVDRLSGGAVVGEMALLTAPERNATVTAASAAKLWRLDRADFERLTGAHPHILAAVHKGVRPRLERAELAPLLTDRFGAQADADMAAIQSQLTWRKVSRGAALYGAGDPAAEAYIVVAGKFVVRDVAGNERRIVGRGAVLGEEAVVGHASRSNEAVAMRESHVVAFPTSLAASSPRFLARLAADLMERSGTVARVGTSGAAVMLVAASKGAPLSEVATGLAERLGEWGRTVVLSSRTVDDRFGRDGVAQVQEDHELAGPLALWLDQQTRAHDHVLLVADDHDTPWVRRCLRLADTAYHVVETAREPDSALGTAIEQDAPDLPGELVLVQPESTALPTGTSRWLGGSPYRAHHHVRLGSGRDMDRLARRVGGRAVGLALSGGGARGYVHIGLLRALEERGVPVDVVFGTSMGAVIGAAYALVGDADACEKLAARFGDRKQLLDRTLPLVALTRSRRVNETLKSMYGSNVDIEDLWTPFACVSASLTHAEPRLHATGPLWRAVRASAAIPGIFTPLLAEGGDEVLVDGGVMNNLPADLLREHLGPGTVIASNAYGGRADGKRLAFGDDVSGWSVLRSKLLPFGRKVRAPSLLGTLMRSTSLASKYLLDEAGRYADLVVTYPSSEVTSLEFDHYVDTIAAGYHHGSEAVDGWIARRGS